jgi:hypothetical protein
MTAARLRTGAGTAASPSSGAFSPNPDDPLTDLHIVGREDLSLLLKGFK